MSGSYSYAAGAEAGAVVVDIGGAVDGGVLTGHGVVITDLIMGRGATVHLDQDGGVMVRIGEVIMMAMPRTRMEQAAGTGTPIR